MELINIDNHLTGYFSFNVVYKNLMFTIANLVVFYEQTLYLTHSWKMSSKLTCSCHVQITTGNTKKRLEISKVLQYMYLQQDYMHAFSILRQLCLFLDLHKITCLIYMSNFLTGLFFNVFYVKNKLVEINLVNFSSTKIFTLK